MRIEVHQSRPVGFRNQEYFRIRSNGKASHETSSFGSASDKYSMMKCFLVVAFLGLLATSAFPAGNESALRTFPRQTRRPQQTQRRLLHHERRHQRRLRPLHSRRFIAAKIENIMWGQPPSACSERSRRGCPQSEARLPLGGATLQRCAAASCKGPCKTKRAASPPAVRTPVSPFPHGVRGREDRRSPTFRYRSRTQHASRPPRVCQIPVSNL